MKISKKDLTKIIKTIIKESIEWKYVKQTLTNLQNEKSDLKTTFETELSVLNDKIKWIEKSIQPIISFEQFIIEEAKNNRLIINKNVSVKVIKNTNGDFILLSFKIKGFDDNIKKYKIILKNGIKKQLKSIYSMYEFKINNEYVNIKLYK